MKVLSIVVLVALVAVVACPASGEIINIGRSDVLLTVPEGYSKDSPAPLLVSLHGYTSSGAGQDAYMKFSEVVEEYGFLLLMPDGTKEPGGDKNPFWNATAACCDFYDTEVDDSGYLLDLIGEVKKKYAVDENRVFLFGHSNGGFMAHRMAYDHPDTIAAIASLAGAALLEMNGPTPKRPVSVLQIHGTRDTLNVYGGGEIQGVRYPGANETAEKWAVHNDVELKKKDLRKKIDLDRGLEGKETTVTRFDKRGTVELWTIDEGSHIPSKTDDFTPRVIEWLLGHPKAE